jgi:hypothetical protein
MAATRLNLILERVIDAVARENFQKIAQFVANSDILRPNFKFYEIIFTQAETNKKIPHRLKFIPKDVIQTSLTGAGDITWHYDLFDETYLVITTTDACVVRALIGTHPNR